MQLTRCPVCHSRIGLEQLVQDEAGRELLALLSKLDTLTGSVLVSYIGLFRSANRDLANDRALKLAQETLAIEAVQWLTPALQETVEAIKDKRALGDVKPLNNHNYLKRVLESVVKRGCNVGTLPAHAPQVGYATGAASIARIQDTSW
ncbi:MAG: hypothetical protein COB09_02485 [Thalassobium sp.]|nr:MAG: hypothetical protein COB09_02485 [Thalassobium sp.]